MEDIKKDAEERMLKATAALDRDFGRLRTGRASASILDDVKVDYYGKPTPISQIASMATPDSRTITVQPWEKNSFSPVEKAILKSDLGLTPVNDGKLIRIVIPALTEERRKELVKIARKYGEETRVAVRNIRREANEALKKLEKDKSRGYSEDDVKKAQEAVQKLTDGYVAGIDEKCKAKEKEIMEV
jgi:ribosome recycling factor